MTDQTIAEKGEAMADNPTVDPAWEKQQEAERLRWQRSNALDFALRLHSFPHYLDNKPQTVIATAEAFHVFLTKTE